EEWLLPCTTQRGPPSSKKQKGGSRQTKGQTLWCSSSSPETLALIWTLEHALPAACRNRTMLDMFSDLFS
ncbi:hypothetical protein U9M48_040849, partial [Paspalum notatum var. saurae]